MKVRLGPGLLVTKSNAQQSQDNSENSDRGSSTFNSSRRIENATQHEKFVTNVFALLR